MPVRVLLVMVVCCFGVAVGESPDYSHELPRIAPTPANEALATFQVATGFRIDAVAAEPLVASPVAIEWDAAGEMYVCEMRGYSENRDERLSRIARLVDTDGDGVYDRRDDFATGLLWPTALYPFDGGWFVADAPDIVYLKDSDGDGVCDVRRRVLTGFGVSNVQGLLNSFRWGLDNRIHVACSSNGGEIRSFDPATGEMRPDPPVNIRGRDLALDPRTYEFELTSGAAQHGMCFDDWGRKFVSSNSDHLQQVMYDDRYVANNPFVTPPPARVSIATDGPQAEVFRQSPVEPWRIVRTRLRVTGQVKGIVEGGGRAAGYFTGATGATIYRGDAWPESVRGLAIVGDVGSNLVHRKRLTPEGVRFRADRIDEQSEFVTSSDIWFRPAQFANAPDGSLHVVDMYREVIEHPHSLPPEIKQHLDLTSGRDRGRIYRIVPHDYRHRATPKMTGMDAKQWVAMLGHPNAWHRETASRLLVEAQDRTTIELLHAVTRDSASTLGRMHAMYALEGLGAIGEEIVIERLGDDHSQVRRHALRLAESLPVTTALVEAMEPLVDDPSIDVRYQLAWTLGVIDTERRVSMLERLIRRDVNDDWMRFAVLCSAGEATGALADSLASEVAFQAGAGLGFIAEARKTDAARDRFRVRNEAVAAMKPSAPTKETPPHPPAPRSNAKAREAVVARYREALTLEGDASRGEPLFAKHCAACHRVGDVGREMGPNLAAMKTRGAEAILVNVLDPNREVNPQYINHTLVTVDGRVLAGLLVAEGATSVTIQKPESEPETILRIDIEEVRSTGLSIMPEGFEEHLTPQSLADLIAFLMR